MAVNVAGICRENEKTTTKSKLIFLVNSWCLCLGTQQLLKRRKKSETPIFWRRKWKRCC